ncbi:major facilitator superfamily protein [Helicosporidium sp. ATCC 50920]|nr:major facilitator superfamily protein [Helicosporidium sp. ATCC 50920]|eukprot:KDD76841.1 major facilitator superfamily protein [Helicosporidium sp. ATCC 50920]
MEDNPPARATWITPRFILCLFCVVNALIYVDRGVIASNGVNGAPASGDEPGYGIVGTFGLTLFEDGLLPAAFMVGLLLASPIFAQASHRASALRLMGLGLAIWSLAAAGCALSTGFWSLLFSRMLVGVGEASFVALAAPFIDDAAPPHRKTQWLAFFYLCIPAGIASGYVIGGVLAAALGWRAPFLIEAVVMLPFVAFCQTAPPLRLKGSGREEEAWADSGAAGGSEAGPSTAQRQLPQLRVRVPLTPDVSPAAAPPPSVLREAVEHWGTLLQLPVFLSVLVGMTGMTCVLGTFAYYGPKAAREVFQVPPERADLSFGAVTIVTGIAGTLAGGLLLDRVGSSVRNALVLCGASLLCGGVLLTAAFALAPTYVSFMAVIAAGELGLFMSQAPSNAAVLWSVPQTLRPTAMSLSVIAIHLFGDVPGPPLLGLLQQRLQAWRLSLGLWSAILLLAGGAYLYALGPLETAPDYRQGEAGGGAGGAEEGNGGGAAAPSEADPLLNAA